MVVKNYIQYTTMASINLFKICHKRGYLRIWNIHFGKKDLFPKNVSGACRLLTGWWNNYSGQSKSNGRVSFTMVSDVKEEPKKAIIKRRLHASDAIRSAIIQMCAKRNCHPRQARKAIICKSWTNSAPVNIKRSRSMKHQNMGSMKKFLGQWSRWHATRTKQWWQQIIWNWRKGRIRGKSIQWWWLRGSCICHETCPMYPTRQDRHPIKQDIAR